MDLWLAFLGLTATINNPYRWYITTLDARSPLATWNGYKAQAKRLLELYCMSAMVTV